jgi:hypothetical protein
MQATSGCPTVAALETALQGQDVASLLTTMSTHDGDITVPFTTLSEAKTFLADNCVNVTMGDGSMCMGRDMADMMGCVSF